METVAYNFHDESGASVGAFKLNAGKMLQIYSILFLLVCCFDFSFLLLCDDKFLSSKSEFS